MFGRSLIEHDEQRHFTTGVMAFDYLRHGLASNPIRFGKSFAARYPEVAIGHWPPAYYAVQALFYLIAGPTTRSAQLLSVLTAAGLAAMVFLRVRPAAGAGIAAGSAAVLLALPLIQIAAWEVMSDLLTGFFCFLAILAFSDLLDDPRNWKATAWFLAWSAMALLSKGSAWALAAFVFLAPLLARRLRCMRGAPYWIAVVGMVALGSPFYVLAQKYGIAYQAHYSHFINPTVVQTPERLERLRPLLGFAPVLLILSGVAGAAEALWTRWVKKDESAWTTLPLSCAAWIGAQVVFLFVLPLTREPRVMMPSLAPLVVLMARLCLWMRAAAMRMAGSGRLAGTMRQGAAAALALAIMVTGGAARLRHVYGYHQAAAAMEYPPDGALLLFAMEPDTTGVLIAERLNQGRQHRDVILRGDHVFVEMDEQQAYYQPQFTTADAIRRYLLSFPVRYVVLPDPPFEYPFQKLLDEAVTGDAKDFHLVGRMPVSDTFNGGQIVRIYENPAGSDHHPEALRIPLGPQASFKMLEYRWPQ